jgi:pilus assembly protein Flp/PilA
MKQLLKNLMTEDSGQDLIEYALVAALVGLGAVTSIGFLKNSISNTFNTIGTQLTTATA